MYTYKKVDFGIGNGKQFIFQLTNASPSQMMSYIIVTETGRLVIIDGGTKEDAPKLLKYIKFLGGRVDTWLISHLHYDHIGAATYIAENAPEITVGRYVFDAPLLSWFAEKVPGADEEIAANFLSAMEKANVVTARSGMSLTVDKLRIDVLTDCRDCYDYSDINNTSVVYKITFSGKSILFLGDLGTPKGKILAEQYGSHLKSDIVQMAHHGQDGVTRDVYELIAPDACLWPTPDWLWNNDNGGGENSGPWKTLQVRTWMNELGVKKHINYEGGDVFIL